MTRRPFVLIAAIFAIAVVPAPPRISFVHQEPARYDLSYADEIVIVYGIGDNDSVETFVDEFVDRTNRSGRLHFTDVSAHGTHFVGQKPDERTVQRLKRQYRGDAYLGVNNFTCALTPRTGEGSTTDYEGARVKRKHEFVDARCSARVEVFDARSGARTLAFDVSGEGTSPRVSQVTDEERMIARESAARYAAIAAADAITPREVRETIDMEPGVPMFDRAMAYIDAGRLRDARVLWEGVLGATAKPAPLLYDLAAVCEAAGDTAAAREYLNRAIAASPTERRYREAMARFKRRNEK